MLKRLIEVALPLKEVSAQSAREKSIRHGHISTLHIWWARRPLAACRAVVFASLIPDPDDPECPEGFRTLVMETLSRNEFMPKSGDGSAIEDSPRSRCLEFIKHLVEWENSNNPDYLEPARRLIAAAHKFLHPGVEAEVPEVLDPFAGGGAIPLEALRLGCEAHAIDLNPVAHLIELCTLAFPQKFGQPDSRPVPDYIKRLIAHNRAKKHLKGDGRPLLDREEPQQPHAFASESNIIPDVEITEAEYRKNPLASDVRYWGNWIISRGMREIGHLYPLGPDGSIRIAYLWANTLPCPNPACGATVPLVKQLMVANRRHKYYLAMSSAKDRKGVTFSVTSSKTATDDQLRPTIQLGSMRCPVCEQGIYDKNTIKDAAKRYGLGTQPLCVVIEHPTLGREYRDFAATDLVAFSEAEGIARSLAIRQQDGLATIPDEQIGRDFEWVLKPPMFGLTLWRDIFNPRQQVALSTIACLVDEVGGQLNTSGDTEYAAAVQAYLALALDRHADYNSKCQSWDNSTEKVGHTFGRQAIAMSWDYCEVNPFSGKTGDFTGQLEWVEKVIVANTFSGVKRYGLVQRGSATRLPQATSTIAAVITDPPYYDAVPYADLSDFFYVWLKRSMRHAMPELFRTPLTPKADELVQQSEKVTPAEKRKKTKDFFEKGMSQAMSDAVRVLRPDGIASVMFAHKTTAAWEQLISGLVNAGFCVVASWPFHTELRNRLRGQESAALASSVTLVCRKRGDRAGDGLWDDVRQELREVAHERLDFFWSQGIRGADFFISAIGPALSVFGKYERVTKLSGEVVTVGQFLDEVRGLVTNYALAKIMKTSHTGNIDGESQFYVIWRWSYADAKVPADESFKLAQALGMATETMWDRTGVLEKAGENVLAMPIAKRMKIKDLGDSEADGAPASLIDVLHRLCAFREKNDSDGMAQFLVRSGQGNNPALWVVAQAMSDILPDGDKEKQLMQGLLNQKEKLEQAAEQGRLF
jgi:adenine-specific DNA methylase